jgi:hypothetical protein
MKHLIDASGHVHCCEPGSVGYTLCGVAEEGERGDTPVRETYANIDCDDCITIIRFCKRVRDSEIAPACERRARRRG